METRTGSARASPGDEGRRLDVFIAAKTGLSRNRAQRLISDGMVLVDGKTAKKNHLLSLSQEVTWRMPPPGIEEVIPQAISIDIIYQDEHLIVVDKPPGMVMYPGPGHPADTLLNAVLSRYPEIAGVGGRGRSGIFHRLDRGTSGLVALAKTEAVFQKMAGLVKNREVERLYLALVTGTIATLSGVIDAPMGRSPGNRKKMAVRCFGGRKAVTRFLVKERFQEGYSLLEVSLETGRTHQIRVHLSYIGHPVAGDPDYSRGKGRRELGLERQFLHAYRLRFEHPVTGERLEFNSELPGDLRDVLERLKPNS